MHYLLLMIVFPPSHGELHLLGPKPIKSCKLAVAQVIECTSNKVFLCKPLPVNCFSNATVVFLVQGRTVIGEGLHAICSFGNLLIIV